MFTITYNVNRTMNIRQLAQATSRRMLEKYDETIATYKMEYVISTLFDIIAEESLTKPVNIRGFGLFTRKYIPQRKSTLPRDTHNDGIIPARTLPKFKPFSEYKAKMIEFHKDKEKK